MGKIFPPTLAEWHSAVIGFYVGFVYGCTHDTAVATAGIKRIIGFREADGHLSDTRQEAAYAGGCFFVGVLLGHRWHSVRSADENA